MLDLYFNDLRLLNTYRFFLNFKVSEHKCTEYSNSWDAYKCWLGRTNCAIYSLALNVVPISNVRLTIAACFAMPKAVSAAFISVSVFLDFWDPFSPILLVNQTQISIVKGQPSPPGEFASHCLTDNECKFAHSECRSYTADEPGQCYCISGFEFNGYDCLPNEHNVAVLEKSQYGSNCTTTIDEGYHLVCFSLFWEIDAEKNEMISDFWDRFPKLFLLYFFRKFPQSLSKSLAISHSDFLKLSNYFYNFYLIWFAVILPRIEMIPTLLSILPILI